MKSLWEQPKAHGPLSNLEPEISEVDKLYLAREWKPETKPLMVWLNCTRVCCKAPPAGWQYWADWEQREPSTEQDWEKKNSLFCQPAECCLLTLLKVLKILEFDKKLGVIPFSHGYSVTSNSLSLFCCFSFFSSREAPAGLFPLCLRFPRFPGRFGPGWASCN